MSLVNTASLIRGETIVDYALMGDDFAAKLNAADYVGIVAACIDRGVSVNQIERKLGASISAEIAEVAQKMYHLFEGPRRQGGLWREGGALDDITFVHPTLDARYPDVNSDPTETFENF